MSLLYYPLLIVTLVPFEMSDFSICAGITMQLRKEGVMKKDMIRTVLKVEKCTGHRIIVRVYTREGMGRGGDLKDESNEVLKGMLKRKVRYGSGRQT
jgi:hypothetical protein